MKGKIGLVFTETGQAEVEIPEEKDAKHSTVSSSDREICGSGGGNMVQSCLYGWQEKINWGQRLSG